MGPAAGQAVLFGRFEADAPNERWVGDALHGPKVAGYLNHHLKIAGRADTLFSTDAITVIHNAARGYPRAVNNLAINALTAAFARKSAIVDEKAARIAVTENGGD